MHSNHPGLNHLARCGALIAGAGILAVLAACSAQDSTSVVGTLGTTDTIAVSPSVTVAAVVGGGRQTVSLSFNSTGSATLTNLTVTSGLSSLPAGWSGPSSFSCASVSTGSGCLLNLAYAPTKVGTGTITIGYSYKDSAGTAQIGTTAVNYTGTTNNNVIGTAAPAGQVTATVGQGSQSVAVTFTTDDGNPATALTLTTDLVTLPDGWTSTAKSFTCATLSTGNGCQLMLTYAPPAVASGTLTLNYNYKDNSGDPKTGAVSLKYVGTEFDNVVGAVAPSGQVVAVVGAGTQAVKVTFTTDDGHQATGLTLTSALTALPSGWSSTASSFTCATVSTGNGCQLPLSFTPTAAGGGTIALTYSYTDVGGHAKTGTVNIPYAGTTNNNVVGNTSPSGQVNAVVGAMAQTVVISFDTDDGNPASGFAVTTNLTNLPAGWSSRVSRLACTQASTGSTCQLTLTYTPTADASGTLAIGFAYTDNAGKAKTGTVSIPYAATEHDNVVGTTSPSGQVSDVIGNAPQPVTVTFTTDDGNPASALSITSGLSSLPLGWTSSASSFTCSSISTGTGCQLSLTFTPTATATGTLSFGYAYTDNAGTPKTGTVTIPYISTSHNTILGSPNPGGTVRVKVGQSEPVPVTFTTNDGNTATDFQITSNLSALPGGWSGPGGFSCATVNTGSGCAITLTYAPPTNATGTLTLNFSYIDSASTPQTGTATIEYSNPHVYLFGAGNGTQNGTYVCSIIADGSLDTCALTANSADTVNTFGPGVINGAYAYLPGNDPTSGVDEVVYTCSFEPDGTFDDCSGTTLGSGLGYTAYGVATSGNYLYANYYDHVYVCTYGAAGSLTNCGQSASSSPTSNYYGLAVNSNFAFLTDYSYPAMCLVSATDGTLGNCNYVAYTGDNAGVFYGGPIKIFGNYVYASGSGGISTCAIASDGSLPICTTYSVSGGSVNDIAVLGTDAYVVDYSNVYHCTVNQTTGALSACAVSDGNLTTGGSGLLAQ